MGDSEESDFIKLFFEDMDRILEDFKKKFPLLRAQEGQKEALSDIHRYAHSIKGLSASVGFEKIRLIAQKLEGTLKKIIDKDTPIDERTLGEIENSFRNIERLTKNEKQNSSR